MNVVKNTSQSLQTTFGQHLDNDFELVGSAVLGEDGDLSQSFYVIQSTLISFIMMLTVVGNFLVSSCF
jgi:hypothetical protein